jgi:cell fate regulator YaaT (PSP1 superfamily)
MNEKKDNIDEIEPMTSSNNENTVMYRTKFTYSCENEYCRFSVDEPLSKGQWIVADTRYGKDLLQVLGPIENHIRIKKDNIRRVCRIATDDDMKKNVSNQEKEKEAYKVCREKIRKHQLDMKLVTAHYLLEEAKVMFFFTADNRIDFRELVKDLVSIFRMRIELRQIGVRDESRFLGGVAVCGRNLCCHGVMDYLRPVSIKMAKEQNLSLNSLKISGPCGRLLCCLSYEYDYYVAEKHNFPSEGHRIYMDNLGFRVSEVNIFSQTVVLYGPEGRRFTVSRDQFYRQKDQGRWCLRELPEDF